MFNDTSHLQDSISDGPGAMLGADRDLIEQSVRKLFLDSIDVDAAFNKATTQRGKPLGLFLGYEDNFVVALEPHHGNHKEVKVVIAKKRSCRDQIKAHVIPGREPRIWPWVSKNTDFIALDKARPLLDQEGILYVGKIRLKKHLKKI